jgi:hypothetical protein
MTDDLAAHRYVPDAMTMGDCRICGHVDDAPMHTAARAADRAALSRPAPAPDLDWHHRCDIAACNCGRCHHCGAEMPEEGSVARLSAEEPQPEQRDTAECGAAPGSRRFRDLLARERHDVEMLARHLAEMYDEISGGLISKPNTRPFEVIRLYHERMDREIEEAVAEARAELLADIRERVEGLPVHYAKADPLSARRATLDRAAVRAILAELDAS